MPVVIIKTGLFTPNGDEEVLSEYLCDVPGCPNVAVHPLGCVRELRAVVVVCAEHIPPVKRPSGDR